MAAPNNQKSGVGFRHCVLYEVNDYGVIKPTDENAYEGLHLSGVRTLELAIPNIQPVNHYGDDRIFAIDQLPPNESASGNLVVGKNNFDVDALLTGVKIVTLGETKWLGRATDLQGSEKQVCLHAWRQALDTSPSKQRVRIWDSRLLPLSQLFPMNSNFAEAPEEKNYSIRPQVSTAYPWGIPFAVPTEGYTEAQMLDGSTVNKPKLIAFLGNASATVFTLPTAFPAVDTTKMTVWQWLAANQTASDVTSTVALTTTSIDFTTPGAPATGDIITCWYEYA